MVSKQKKSKKKVVRKTQSKLIKKVQKKSASTLNTITRHGYSLSKKSSDRLIALTKYTNKFGIRKTISQLSKLISRYITDNKISKILVTDIKNLQRWLTKGITKSLKGGDKEDVKKKSSMLEQLIALSKKLGEQTSILVQKSRSKIMGAMSSSRNQLEDAVSGQVKKMTNLSAKITKKTSNLNNKGIKTIQGNKKNTNVNNTNFTNSKCELCMKHCTANGKAKPKNKVIKNSPIEKVSGIIINNQSKRIRKRKRNSNKNNE